MTIQMSYNQVHENFATLLDHVIADREIIVINRQGYEDVALVTASELASLLETAHLLRSPKNAKRLLKALQRAQMKTLQPITIADLRQEVGLDENQA